MNETGFSLEVRGAQGAAGVLCLAGRLDFAHAASLWDETTRALLARAPAPASRLDFNLSGVTAVDGGTMALLVHLRNRLAAEGVSSEFVGAGKDVQEMVHLYEGDLHLPPRKRRKAESALAQIGRGTIAVFLEGKLVFAFFGQMLLSAIATIRSPRTGNWKDVAPTMERAGADAVPIVVLINFLIGFVMAFQGAVQLKQFGADIFVADLVGVSLTRELGPLMTAIIVCGRSGAAFAAELGSMKVSEEIDALRTMGFGTMRFLVLPRALALILVLPALTLIADFVGILGGLVMAVTTMHISIAAYVTQTVKAVHVWDVYSGLIKSAVFALAIVLVACQQGLATTGGAEGVGRRTTAAVVTTLFSLILLDAGFTILLQAFHA